MRIIAGEWRGRKIIPSVPSCQIVREVPPVPLDDTEKPRHLRVTFDLAYSLLDIAEQSRKAFALQSCTKAGKRPPVAQ